MYLNIYIYKKLSEIKKNYVIENLMEKADYTDFISNRKR